MHVRALSPMKESRSTWVSLLALKGRWAPLRPRARIHSWSYTIVIIRKQNVSVFLTLRASRDLLISAPSILVCLLAELVSAPLSLPARSMRENLPCRGFLLLLVLRMIWNTAWLLEEWALALVWPEVRRLLPWVISFRTSSTQSTWEIIILVNKTKYFGLSAVCIISWERELTGTWDKPEGKMKNEH